MEQNASASADSTRASQSQIDVQKAPGHWVLARLGKRVLRPGGLKATRLLLRGLGIGAGDDVIEFAPGIGLTAEMILAEHPASYTGVDRDAPMIERLRNLLGPKVTMVNAEVQKSGLPAASATKLVGEAMLSMHPAITKQAIMAEACRLLRTGGLYGIHELAIIDDHLDEAKRKEMRQQMSQVVHNGVTPLTTTEWKELLQSSGFEVKSVSYVPFRLLNPGRLLSDEGLAGTARILKNLLRDAEARRRVMAMRRTFKQYGKTLSAVVIISQKR